MVLPQNIFDIIFPVGYIYLTEGESPQSIFDTLGIQSTWTKIEGRMLIGSGTNSSKNWTFNLGEEGGDSAVPSHNHSLSSVDASFSGRTSSNGSHSHTVSAGPNTSSSWSSWGGNNGHSDPNSVSKTTSSAGSHSHSFSGSVSLSGSTSSQGSTDTSILPPYHVVDMYIRSL